MEELAGLEGVEALLDEIKKAKGSHFPAHDLFYKDTSMSIRGCFLATMQLALTAEEYDWFDWDEAYFSQEVFVDEDGREIRADLVCIVPLKPEIQKRLERQFKRPIKKCKFISLIEHKSHNDDLVCKQLIKIMSLAAEDDCLVIPIVVYHGVKPWRAPLSLHELLKKTNPLFNDATLRKAFAKNIPNFEYRLVDLNKMTVEELEARGLTYDVFPYTLKVIWQLSDNKMQVLQDILIRAEKMPDEDHKVFLHKLWNYIRLKYPGLVTKEVMVKAATQARAQKARRNSQTLEDCVIQQQRELDLAQGHQQGHQQGMQQGREEGREEGQQNILTSLLEHLPAEQVAKMTSIPLDKVLEIKRKGKA